MSKAEFGTVREQCESCRCETPHDVTIQQKTEAGPGVDHPEFSREPYRVTECEVCGTVGEVRLNNVR